MFFFFVHGLVLAILVAPFRKTGLSELKLTHKYFVCEGVEEFGWIYLEWIVREIFFLR